MIRMVGDDNCTDRWSVDVLQDGFTLPVFAVDFLAWNRIHGFHLSLNSAEFLQEGH